MTLLRCYSAFPCDDSSRVDINDYFTGNGVTTTFALSNKTGVRLDETVQAGINQWNRFNSSLTVSGNNFTTNTPPSNGATVIAPGVSKIIARAYDQDTVEGEVTPRFKQYPVYVAPETAADILQFRYGPVVGQSGIRIQCVDKDLSVGADLTWLQIALSDSAGNPLSYFSSGTAQYITPILNASLSTGAVLAGATTIDVTDGSLFFAGEYIMLEPTIALKEEQVRIVSILGNTLTVTPLAFSHASAIGVYQWARKIWIKTNIPLNASGGTPVNLREIAAKLMGTIESRL